MNSGSNTNARIVLEADGLHVLLAVAHQQVFILELVIEDVGNLLTNIVDLNEHVGAVVLVCHSLDNLRVDHRRDAVVLVRRHDLVRHLSNIEHHKGTEVAAHTT
ncbi:hypothetical protein D3C76_1638010 [compost metagenome]